VIRLVNDELLLVYHQTDRYHLGPEGRVVSRRSEDYGRTWSDPVRIHDESGRDATAPSVVYDPHSDHIVVFDFLPEFHGTVTGDEKPTRHRFDTCIIRSGDGGQTWSEPSSIGKNLIGGPSVPFGGGVRTNRGIMTAFHSRDWDIEVMFSDDGGISWGSNVIVANSPDGRELSEPVPCAISDSRVILFGRDNVTGDFFAVRSSDGGRNLDGADVLQSNRIETSKTDLGQTDRPKRTDGRLGRS
jgi:hypothetical protein